MSSITVYTARRVRTMNPSNPVAAAIAVRDGRIVEVGDLPTLKPWLDAFPHEIDDRFADKVIMPGFIDPHLHPSLAAVLLPCQFITAMEWRLPNRVCPPVRGHDAYMARLKEIEAGLADPSAPLVTWGFHRIWHGEVTRETLNAVSADRPIVVWQRSFHEIVANDAAIDWMKLDRAELERHPQVDMATGRFFETGLALATQAMNPYLTAPERFGDGLRLVRQAVHHGGHTTIGDLAWPLVDDATEWPALCAAFDNEDTPFRIHLVPRAALRGTWESDVETELERVAGYGARSTRRLIFGNGVKLFADGGFFAELMQVQEPGFIDGHGGEWMMAPESIEACARAFWNAGKRIHIHCTGDMGVELALDILERLQFERPRFNHRFTIEHFGVSTPEQARRIADLGACVSANVYYVHELGDAYWKHSIGRERATAMARLGALARHGVVTALHSDFTMAPAQPLNSAWVAVNRIGETGEVMGPEERISLDAAMRAITIDAAYVLGMENEVGSLRAGKMADFTVLEADPWETPLEELKDIPIWGTVFEGRPWPIG